MQGAATQNPLAHVADSEEIIIGFTRPEGTEGSTPIWVVRVGDDIYVRSVKGERGGWFRRLGANPDGSTRDGDHLHPIRAERVTDAATLDAVTQAYTQKYRGSPHVAPLLADETRNATFHLVAR
jgi:hypothetical protein